MRAMKRAFLLVTVVLLALPVRADDEAPLPPTETIDRMMRSERPPHGRLTSIPHELRRL